MAILNQKTINNTLILRVSLCTKVKMQMRILPSEPNSGIVFKRIDLRKDNLISANFFNVSDATLCTTLTNEANVKVSTVEHLMAAFYGMGVDNALVEMDHEEIPIMDGSSKVFVEAIKQSGLRNSSTPIKIIKILNKVEVKHNNKHISIEPTNTTLEIDFEIKFNNELIGTQKLNKRL